MRQGVLLFALLVLVAPARAQNTPSLKDVVRRVESYVGSYGEQASIVVCTERYDQTSGGSGMAIDGKRSLVSDFAIVKTDAIRGWLGFRDVLEVDGHVVADRDDRLARVLMASQGRFDEARRLSDESARYNIGFIERNFNIPTAALFFFTPDNHDRFKFTARRVAADATWEMAFHETSRPSLIRTPQGESVMTAGTVAVRPEDGVVVRTRLMVDLPARTKQARRGQGQIDVVYRYVDALDLWLPASMDESFEAARQGVWERVTGHAEYSNYRTFTTSGRIK